MLAGGPILSVQFLVISGGELWLHGPDGASTQIVSPFATEMLQRETDRQRTTSWKHAEREGGQGLIGPALWGRGDGNASLTPPRFHHVCRAGDPRTIYYVLSVGRTIGLFRYHLDEQREIRLFHRQQTQILGLAYLPQTRHVVMAAMHGDGTAHLDVYDEEGTHKGSITHGDSIDAAPAAMPGAEATVVYQSWGLARNADSGAMVGIGHSAVHWVDYRAGEMDSLIDDAAWDHVAPRISADRVLYAIRRPADKPLHEKAGGAAKDALLMPLRLGKAVFGYLNVFSMLYGKEPLRSAGGPRAPQLDQDLGSLWLHGRRIELSKVRNDPEYAGNLVPGSWKLVAQAGRHAAAQEIASHVAQFDVLDDGSLLYSNGYDIWHWRGGEARKLARRELVEGLLGL